MSPAPTVYPPLVDESWALEPGQYNDEHVTKDLVVLHHTVSQSWTGTVRFWNSDPQRVGTAYGVHVDGTVYRAFPDDRWAIHLFRYRKGAPPTPSFSAGEAMSLERRSIGIELVSLGALTEKDGQLLDAYGGRLGRADELLEAGRVVRFDPAWRGVTWFAVYTEAQIAAVIKLVTFLCLTRGIPPTLPPAIARAEGEPRQWLGFKGVVSHAMLRPDKSDTHPGFPYDRLAYALGCPWNGGRFG